MAEFYCKNLDETRALAKKFGALIKKNGVFISLLGEIGAGKTAFTKFLLEYLGVSVAVTSPSFVILNEYHGSNHLPVYHFDLYRLEEEGVKTISSELCEYSREGVITLVEWADFGAGELPFERINLKVSYGEGEDSEHGRMFEFEAAGEKYRGVVEALEEL